MDIFEFQIDILKQEIDNLQASIRNWNSIFYVIKGWSITLFSGLFAISMHLGKPNILFLVIISSLMFWIIETYARIVQKHFISRYNKIEYVIRKQTSLNKIWEKRDFSKYINMPDMRGKVSVKEIKSKTSFFHTATRPFNFITYFIQILIALVSIFLYFNGML